VVHDALPDCGPLVGATAGLERANHPWLAVLAIDLGAMTPAWFHGLRADCAPGVGVIGRRDGFFEPLAAIYPREFKWLAWEALARGEYAFQRLAARAVQEGVLRVREIRAEEAEWFANWNEPAAPSADPAAP
jgi:molybdopterin-guanine dinucleotide biosynthesis protein A